MTSAPSLGKESQGIKVESTILHLSGESCMHVPSPTSFMKGFVSGSLFGRGGGGGLEILVTVLLLVIVVVLFIILFPGWVCGFIVAGVVRAACKDGYKEKVLWVVGSSFPLAFTLNFIINGSLDYFLVILHDHPVVAGALGGISSIVGIACYESWVLHDSPTLERILPTYRPASGKESVGPLFTVLAIFFAFILLIPPYFIDTTEEVIWKQEIDLDGFQGTYWISQEFDVSGGDVVGIRVHANEVSRFYVIDSNDIQDFTNWVSGLGDSFQYYPALSELDSYSIDREERWYGYDTLHLVIVRGSGGVMPTSFHGGIRVFEGNPQEENDQLVTMEVVIAVGAIVVLGGLWTWMKK